MIYLVWAILNIGLFLFFVFVCFRATKLIKEKLGLFASIIFVFTLLSFVDAPNSSEQKLGETFDFNLDKDENKTYNNKRSEHVTLDNNLIFFINLNMVYNKNVDTITPILAGSAMSGLVAGHRWKAQTVTANVVGQTIKYTVDGLIEWKLLGLNIYTQSKTYTGSIDTR